MGEPYRPLVNEKKPSEERYRKETEITESYLIWSDGTNNIRGVVTKNSIGKITRIYIHEGVPELLSVNDKQLIIIEEFLRYIGAIK